MILAALLASAAFHAGLPLRNAVIECGDAHFAISSGLDAGRFAPLAPRTQQLTLRRASRVSPVTLEQAFPIIIQGHRVLGRFVVSWACVEGSGGAHYLVLGYSCAIDPGAAGDCGGEKEWFRLLDARGRFVDAAVPQDGPERDRLYSRLGISKEMDAGVDMTPVVPDH
jgi:hypothetical protein